MEKTHYFYITLLRDREIKGRDIHHVKLEGTQEECLIALQDYKIRHAEFIANAKVRTGVAPIRKKTKQKGK